VSFNMLAIPKELPTNLSGLIPVENSDFHPLNPRHA